MFFLGCTPEMLYAPLEILADERGMIPSLVSLS